MVPLPFVVRVQCTAPVLKCRRLENFSQRACSKIEKARSLQQEAPPCCCWNKKKKKREIPPTTGYWTATPVSKSPHSSSSREHSPAHVPDHTPDKGRIGLCGVLHIRRRNMKILEFRSQILNFFFRLLFPESGVAVSTYQYLLPEPSYQIQTPPPWRFRRVRSFSISFSI